MVPVKNPDESIGRYIQQMNDATSLGVDATASVNRIGWFTIIVNALGTFLRIFMLQRYIRNGVDGFVVARLASIYSLVKNIKRWEYQMRKHEGGSIHPPLNDEDLRKVKTKYSV
jgi:hypothetical protein